MLDENVKRNFIKAMIVIILLGIFGIITFVIVKGENQKKVSGIITDQSKERAAAVSKIGEPAVPTGTDDRAAAVSEVANSSSTDLMKEECTRASFDQLKPGDFYKNIDNSIKNYAAGAKAEIEKMAFDHLLCTFQKNQIEYKQGKEILSSLVIDDYIVHLKNQPMTTSTKAVFAFFSKQDDNKNNWSKAFNFPVIDFVFAGISDLCNAGKVSPLFLANNLDYIQDVGKITKPLDFYRTYFNNFCTEVKNLDQEKFNSEILNFKNWSQDQDVRDFELSWKTKMAMRYISNISNGERIDLKMICSSLPSENEKKVCQGRLDNLYSLKNFVNAPFFHKITTGSCQTEKNELIDYICAHSVIKTDNQ